MTEQPAPAASGLVTVHVLDVVATGAARLAELERALSAEERARAERHRFEEDRVAYRAAHGLARTLIGARALVEPADLRFDRGPHGKPFVLEPRGGRAVSFNLSHTRRYVAVIVGDALPVGVDIEPMISLCEVRALSHRFFSPEEVADLDRTSGAAMLRRFFTMWTLKEAYVKARGVGLSAPLDTFSFELDPHHRPIRLRDRDVPEDELGRWRFGVEPISDHLVAWVMDPGERDVCVEMKYVQA